MDNGGNPGALPANVEPARFLALHCTIAPYLALRKMSVESQANQRSDPRRTGFHQRTLATAMLHMIHAHHSSDAYGKSLTGIRLQSSLLSMAGIPVLSGPFAVSVRFV
jgi:hypothetical protein